MANTKAKTTTTKTAKSADLQVKQFVNPEDLVKFVNENKVKVNTICPFDSFQAVYYTEK